MATSMGNGFSRADGSLAARFDIKLTHTANFCIHLRWSKRGGNPYLARILLADYYKIETYRWMKKH